MSPIYTPENCTPAFQLNWSYALFWRRAALEARRWQGPLQEALAPDGIRMLSCHQPQPNVTQMLLSTRPPASAQFLVQRVKARLQYLVRERMPSAFRRNYSLSSVGSTKREKLAAYVEQQIEHHQYVDPRFRARLKRFQIARPEVDLSQVRATAHALYTFNLHLVLETEPGEAVYDEPTWHGTT